MKIFTGFITETSSRKVAVIAETKEEANAILSDLYLNGDIGELDYDDYDEWDSKINDEVDIDSEELDDIEIYDEDGNEYEKDDLPENFDFEEV